MHDCTSQAKFKLQNFINITIIIMIKISFQDFPGGTVVKNTPCQCRAHRLGPWSGKIPHATEQLSPCTTTTEPVLYSL